jgi:ribonuclease-3
MREEDGDGRLCSVAHSLYLDRGLDVVNAFILPIFEPALEHILRNNLDKDAKSVLQELSQAHLGHTPRYHTVNTRGPDHDKLFTVAVTINGVTYGKGEGRSKQASAQAAATEAIKQLEAMLNAPVVHVPDGPDFDASMADDLAASGGAS